MLGSTTIKPVAGRVVRASAEGKKKMKVVVTGAGGRTGALVLENLLKDDANFEGYAIVRSDKAKSKASATGIPATNLLTANIVGDDALASLTEAFAGKDALILCTSCVPKINYLSLIPVLIGKLTGEKKRPEFYFEPNGMPEQVDWIGAKNQFEAAKKAGVKRVVVIGSMGGTQKENFLNTLGNGNVLLWKRKAEQFLVKSGLTYTIIHPGGLLDKAGGERELLVDVDDKLLATKNTRVPRADVAKVAVQTLLIKEAENVSFDLSSREPGGGPATPATTAGIQALLKGLGGKTCDYGINKQPEDW